MRKLVTSIVTSFSLSFVPPLVLTVLIAASAVLSLFIANEAVAQDKASYYRIQLKHGEQYLDADHCSTTISLNPGSDFAGGACQLWRLVPGG
jgi:hypothetical protein